MTTQTVGGVRTLHPEHPLAYETCPACGDPLVWEPITLVIVTPSTGRRAKNGTVHTDTAIPVHAGCAVRGGEE